MTDTKQKIELDVEQIKLLLPHRAPFLFVDRLTDIVPNQSAVGHRAVSMSEPHFAGHFPEFPIMPGVLIVEALAQTAGALVAHSMGSAGKKQSVFFLTIEKARFRNPVRPGDMLRMPVKFVRSRGPVFRYTGEAYVGDKLCAEAEFSAMIQEGGYDNLKAG